MASIQDETLEQRLNRLEEIMGKARQVGIDGEMLAQRIEGDLHRLMNTAWLNCSDFIKKHECQQEKSIPFAVKEAMDYAATADEGQAFLKLWLEGDFDVIRKNWADAPESIYGNRSVVL